MWIILADVHLKDSNISIIENLFKELHDECYRKNIHKICILGDFFDTRKGLSTKTMISALNIAEIISSFQVYIITGNHDSLYKNKVEPTALDIFKEHNHITIIKNIDIIENIIMVPWIWDNNVLEDNAYNDKPENFYVFGHFDISGFKMNNNYESKNGIDRSVLKPFKQVYTGHFHTPSEQGNIKYLGSPIPHTFHDEGSPRGYYIFDNEEDSLEFIEFTDAPKFVTISTESSLNEYDIEGNFVRIKFEKDYGNLKNNKIIEEIESKNPLKVKIISDKLVEHEIDEEEEEFVDVISNVELLNRYIDEMKLDKYPNIKKEFLLKILNNILESEDIIE